MNYTTIEQSKKLLELGLNPETADMHFIKLIRDTDTVYIPELLYDEPLSEIDYPCWSLAALLDILPNYQLQTQDDGIGIACSCKGNFNIVTANNPINACYEMILKLHELKML